MRGARAKMEDTKDVKPANNSVPDIPGVLKCANCTRPYDGENRLPQKLHNLHTVCLSCASMLCSQHENGQFSCPLCLQRVPIPFTGVSGLQTNTIVRDLVHQSLKMESRDDLGSCYAHPSEPVTKVCMQCKVGLCAHCSHREHRELERGVAFQEITRLCNGLIERGIILCELTSAQSMGIAVHAESLLADLKSRNLAVFEKMDKLSKLLDSSQDSMKHEWGNVSATSNVTGMSDDILEHFDKGISELRMLCTRESTVGIATETIILATVSVHIDLLRIKMQTSQVCGVVGQLEFLAQMCSQYTSCCEKIVILEGHSLMLTYLKVYRRHDKIIVFPLYILYCLSCLPSLQPRIISGWLLDTLLNILTTYSMLGRIYLPEIASMILSMFLGNPLVDWPVGCPSQLDIGVEVADKVTQWDDNLPINLMIGVPHFLPPLRLLCQGYSESAKFWPIWMLHRCILQYPHTYAPILVQYGGIAVLQKQTVCHTYIRNLASNILRIITDPRFQR